RSLSDGAAAPGGLRSFPTRRSSDLLVTIYAALADKSVAEVLSEFGGQGFGAFKPALGELLVETLRPITARFTGLLDDREALDAILARGAARAREIALPTLDATYRALGLLRG